MPAAVGLRQHILDDILEGVVGMWGWCAPASGKEPWIVQKLCRQNSILNHCSGTKTDIFSGKSLSKFGLTSKLVVVLQVVEDIISIYTYKHMLLYLYT